jgi:hypothetical protein
MITVWPIDDPDTEQIKNDDCDYALDHYDLIASEAAISDAQLQRATFEGEGPYLVGWSPSNARGVPDKLVLVIDMSADNNQARIDQKFLFWKKQIVENPSRWRKGFSIKRVRAAIRIPRRGRRVRRPSDRDPRSGRPAARDVRPQCAGAQPAWLAPQCRP